MATFKFTWGDTIRISNEAPPNLRSGEIASICGLHEVENERQAAASGVARGTLLYLVEFKDGLSLEVPEKFLVPLGKDERSLRTAG